MSFGDQKSIAAQRMGDESYSVLLAVPLPDDSAVKGDLIERPTELREWLLQDVYADWAGINTDIVRHSDVIFGLWPLYGLPKEALSWETVPGLTLIGDAAHLT